METSRELLYRAYGLVVASSFAIPEFDGAAPDAIPDLVVGTTGDRFVDAASCASDGQLPPHVVVFCGENWGFRIAGGTSIQIWEPGVAAREILRAVLIGIALPVALYQRGMWPLHVSAVRLGSQVWLFGGRSGAGKSTIAAWLHGACGFGLVTDDAGVVDLDGDSVMFSAASRALRLLPESVEHAFPDADLRGMLPSVDNKIRIRVGSDDGSGRYVVRGLVMLEYGDDADVGITRMTGAASFDAVRMSIFRPLQGQHLRSAGDALRFCSEFLRRVPVFRFSRRKSLARLPAEMKPLVDLLRTDRSEQEGDDSALYPW